MSANYFKMGDWNVICDRTGFKVKYSSARKEWNNLIVRNQSWEVRHPQDFIRAVKDVQAVPMARPRNTINYLGATEVTADDL